MATDAPAIIGTAPPTGLTLGTAFEATNFASLAGTNIASQANVPLTYLSNSAILGNSTTAPASTVYYGIAPATGGWNSLSNTAKYGIYAGAAAVVVALIILVTVLVVRKRRARMAGNISRDKAIRMTQRSSFASPMYDRSSMPPNPMQNGMGHPGNFGASTSSLQGGYGKGDMSFNDAQSVHSVPPIYAQHTQDQYQHNKQYLQQSQTSSHTNASRGQQYGYTTDGYSYGSDGQPRYAEQNQQQNSYSGYDEPHQQYNAYPPQSPPYQRTANYRQQERYNPYSAFAHQGDTRGGDAGHR